MGDLNRYNFLESTISRINSHFISLPEDEVKQNNKTLHSVLNTLIDKMKEKDPLFKAMFSRIFYGGSYYDGLRVEKPDEFDLDLLLTLPDFAEPVLTTSNVPGFVHLQLKNFDRNPQASTPAYQKFFSFLDSNHFLQTKEVLAWMEGIITKVLNDLPKVNRSSRNTTTVTLHKNGPALNLKLEGAVTIDVDLVPSFVFDQWPKCGFRANPVNSKPEFFIVPKKPKNSGDENIIDRYWRLCFQEQERVLMDDKRTLKPTIKLLKKLRDSLQQDSIASYYIKTVVLHIADAKSDDFWSNSLSYVFMTVLKEYKNFIQKQDIPYYWNKNNNLIGNINPATLTNIAHKLNVVIDNIERNVNDPWTLARYLLNNTELAEFSMNRLTL